MSHRQAVQNLTRQNSDGTVAAVFPGGVRTSSDSPIPFNFPFAPSQHGIQWRAADGGLVAEIQAYDNTLNPPPGQRTSGVLVLEVDSPDGSSYAALELNAGAAGTAAAAAASAGNFRRQILANDGSSDFHQWDSTINLLSRVLIVSFPAMGSGVESQTSIAIPWTTSVVMTGGLAGGNAGSASAMLCTWSFNPTAPGNVNVIIRNNSPFGMAGGGTFTGVVHYR